MFQQEPDHFHVHILLRSHSLKRTSETQPARQLVQEHGPRSDEQPTCELAIIPFSLEQNYKIKRRDAHCLDAHQKYL